MELYALYEIGVVRVEVKTVNINSEAFKKSFLGAQPPIMVENKFVLSLPSSFSYNAYQWSHKYYLMKNGLVRGAKKCLAF